MLLPTGTIIIQTLHTYIKIHQDILWRQTSHKWSNKSKIESRYALIFAPLCIFQLSWLRLCKFISSMNSPQNSLCHFRIKKGKFYLFFFDFILFWLPVLCLSIYTYVSLCSFILFTFFSHTRVLYAFIPCFIFFFFFAYLKQTEKNKISVYILYWIVFFKFLLSM